MAVAGMDEYFGHRISKEAVWPCSDCGQPAAYRAWNQGTVVAMFCEADTLQRKVKKDSEPYRFEKLPAFKKWLSKSPPKPPPQEATALW